MNGNGVHHHVQQGMRARAVASTVGDILQVQAQARLLAGAWCGSRCVFWVAGGRWRCGCHRDGTHGPVRSSVCESRRVSGPGATLWGARARGSRQSEGAQRRYIHMLRRVRTDLYSWNPPTMVSSAHTHARAHGPTPPPKPPLACKYVTRAQTHAPAFGWSCAYPISHCALALAERRHESWRCLEPPRPADLT